MAANQSSNKNDSNQIINLPATASTPPTVLAQVLSATEGASQEEILQLINKVVDNEFELRRSEEQNRYSISMQAIEQQKQAETGTKNNLRIIVLSFFAAFLASLGYAGVTQDTNLPSTVFGGALGLLGGGGGTAAVLAQREKNKQP